MDTGDTYKDPDLGKGVIGLACLIIAIILAIALCCHVATEGVRPIDDMSQRTLILDTGNAASMHKYGMPTAEDAMNYKMHGVWGYKDQDGKTALFNKLPGGYQVWYELYGMEGDKL